MTTETGQDLKQEPSSFSVQDILEQEGQYRPNQENSAYMGPNANAVSPSVSPENTEVNSKSLF